MVLRSSRTSKAFKKTNSDPFEFSLLFIFDLANQLEKNHVDLVKF